MFAERDSQITHIISLLVIMCLLSVPAYAKYGGGTGEPNDPYLIYTPEQMNEIGLHEEDWDSHFKLMADIDLSGYTGTEFNIIGYYRSVQDYKYFRGVFDGNGHTISNFTYNTSSKGNIAIFDTISPELTGEGGEVKNLGLIDPNVHAPAGHVISTLVSYLENGGAIRNCYVRGGRVTGGKYVGGLVGLNGGSITRSHAHTEVAGSGNLGGLVGSNSGRIDACYASGRVGGEDCRGGLVGYNSKGTITNSYATVDIYATGFSIYMGGLVGATYAGTITKCYSVGTIFANGESWTHGGLIGWTFNIPFTVVDCFWDTQTSGIHFSYGGAGLATAQMMDPRVYSLNGWAGDPNWVLDPGNDYPRLAWEGKPGHVIPEPVIDWFDGRGTQEDPFIISTADQLAHIGTASILWDKAFLLVSDLDLTGTSLSRIGVCPGTEFTGTFDGGGHAISNLMLGTDSIPAFSLGLFGHIGPRGQVKNLALQNAVIKGWWVSERIGVLAGTNQGIVTDCLVNGSVFCLSSSRYLGGLVGYSDSGAEISKCRAAVNVTGEHYTQNIGGLVGSNAGSLTSSFATGSVVSGDESETIGGLAGGHSGTVTDCYATGPVSAGKKSSRLGGLVGKNLGHVTQCYSTGGVTGDRLVGGLVGSDDGMVTSCFWDTQTSRQTVSAGGSGRTTAQMQTARTFLNVGWDFMGETANGTQDIWWINEGKDYPKLWWEAK